MAYMEPLTVLVIDYDSSHDWYAAFRGKRVNGRPVKVDQCGWADLSVSAAYDRCVCDISPSEDPIFGSPQKDARQVVPDLVVVRNVARGVHNQDYRNILFGFAYGGVPCLNSAASLLMCQERAVVYGELNRLRRQLGDEAFPFVDAVYHANLGEGMSIAPTAPPLVVKSGTTCAGYGKMRLRDQHDFMDYRTTLSMSNEYFTTEPFHKATADIRIQKVGQTVRAYSRSSDSWKGNMGNVEYEEREVPSRWHAYAEECSKLFGGLDILSVDLLELEDGKEVILELNDSATGLNKLHEKEDMDEIRDIALARLEQLNPAAATSADWNAQQQQEPAQPRPKPAFLAAIAGASPPEPR